MQTRIVALFFAVLLVHVAYATLNPKRVHIVDHDATTNNFLFRGNMPKNEKNEFALADLKTVLAQKAKEELNVTQFPSDFYLVDVSFLNSIVEGKDLQLEEHFFASNPNVGRFVHWTIVGNVINATALPEALRKPMSKELKKWDYDHLFNRTKQLYEWVHQPNPFANKPLVIYMYVNIAITFCEAGVDRTGEVSGSYYMRFLKWTYARSLAFDYAVEPRPIGSASEHAMNWMCWSLHYSQQAENDCNFYIPHK